MTPDERIHRIAELQREADEGRARIAERQAARERDPNSELERLMADQRFTEDKSDLVYTEPAAYQSNRETNCFTTENPIGSERYENEQTASAASLRTALYADNPPAENENDELADAFDKFADAIENRLLDLEKENAELRGRVDMLVDMLHKPKIWMP